MQLRRFITTTVCAVTALAVAQGPVTSIAEGSGVARSAAGQVAEFTFRVVQRTDNPVQGRFRLATRVQGGRTAIVEFLSVERFGVEENKARFAGPAVLIIREGQRSVRRIPGVAIVSVVDVGPRTRERDLIRVDFKTPDQLDTDAATFSFGGAVTRGNIVVRTRTGDRP